MWPPRQLLLPLYAWDICKAPVSLLYCQPSWTRHLTVHRLITIGSSCIMLIPLVSFCFMLISLVPPNLLLISLVSFFLSHVYSPWFFFLVSFWSSLFLPVSCFSIFVRFLDILKMKDDVHRQNYFHTKNWQSTRKTLHLLRTGNSLTPWFTNIWSRLSIAKQKWNSCKFRNNRNRRPCSWKVTYFGRT